MTPFNFKIIDYSTPLNKSQGLELQDK